MLTSSAPGSRPSRPSVEEQRDHLTQLDAAIGDADHGTNLSRGFRAVVAALAATPRLPRAASSR